MKVTNGIVCVSVAQREECHALTYTTLTILVRAHDQQFEVQKHRVNHPCSVRHVRASERAGNKHCRYFPGMENPM
jgi:hypothetical protein